MTTSLREHHGEALRRTRTMKTTKSVAYWVTTGMVVFAMSSGGVAELARRPETIDGMKQLGYPVYFVMILGVWKLLGSVALVIPRFPRLKEWAYAGIFFNMTGAAVSHLVCRDAAWHVAVTLGLAALALASWALRPADRALVLNQPVASREMGSLTAQPA